MCHVKHGPKYQLLKIVGSSNGGLPLCVPFTSNQKGVRHFEETHTYPKRAWESWAGPLVF